MHTEHNPPLSVFVPEDSSADDGAIKQIKACMNEGDALAGSLSADHHLGYSMPIGGTIAYPEYVSPSGVGFDIGCGNKAVATSLLYSDISADLDGIMDEVARRISFGMGRPNNEPVDHPVLDRIERDAPLDGIRGLHSLAAKQLGTVGSGNHYVDLFREEGTDRVWIGVHFGSRGFGHKIASGFLALSQGKGFADHAVEGEINSPPTLLHVDSGLGYTYIEAMKLAGEYAYAGRDVVVDKVLEILGNPAVVHEVHNHHNFAWEESHVVDGVTTDPYGDKVWVVRKGATPLFPGQQGFVGGSMGENAVIIEGMSFQRGASDIADVAGRSALWSAPHGAGRAMSRTEAKGKQRKRWYCRSCGHTQQPGEAAFKDEGYGVRCNSCLDVNVAKKWVTEKAGRIDWKATKNDLARKGIVLRGGDADEAPGAYKRLPAVLAAHSAYVEIRHQLRPIGVAMAGKNVIDKYKD
jgi:tRNA-splicing ligase RtcB